MNILIQATNISKTYSRRKSGGTWMRFGDHDHSIRKTQLHALKDISFQLASGQMLGVVGSNGSGKSTLLRMLGGVGKPSKGELKISGKIGALLDLGGGFQGDLSGRENTILSAVVAGLLRKEVEEKLSQIAQFAEMEDFMDYPSRTYSTGMTMRLAFSVAVHTNPEILLIDEFLSVGDLAFQSKCLNKIKQLRDEGIAIVLVSQGMEQVRELCDVAIWLKKGEMVAYDKAEIVASAYEEEMRAESLRRTPRIPSILSSGGIELRARENRLGSFNATLTEVQILPESEIYSGDPLQITIKYFSQSIIKCPILVASICRSDGTICLDISTQSSGVVLPDTSGASRASLHIERLDLSPGTYFVDIGLFEADWSHAYDYHWHAYRFTVEKTGNHKGVISPPLRWIVAEEVKSN